MPTYVLQSLIKLDFSVKNEINEILGFPTKKKVEGILGSTGLEGCWIGYRIGEHSSAQT